MCVQTLLWIQHHPLTLFLLSRQIKYRQVYEQEIKGKASTEAAAAEAVHARENGENFSQVGSLLHLINSL